MNYQKVTAVIRTDAIEHVERQLQGIGVPGLSISNAKGYGKHADFYTRDWLVDCVRLEIYIEDTMTEEIVQTIMDGAGGNLAGEGIIVVTPVIKFYHLGNNKKGENDKYGAELS